MKIIGENIHIMSPRVKEAIANRDPRVLSGLRQAPGRGRRVGG